jgi:hypothetical protein
MASIGILAAAGTVSAAEVPGAAESLGMVQLQTPEEIKAKLDEIEALKQKAANVTKKIGELAAEGKLPESKEGIDVLKELVEELRLTNEALTKVQQDVEAMRKFMQDQGATNDALKKDVSELKKIKWGFYTQFQWTDTQTGGSSLRNDGFNVRRSRFSATYSPIANTSAKVSVDFSTDSERLSAELKDLIISHKFSPETVVHAGQQSMPLGYEIERSSSSREMPERSLYNRRLFSGERDRGVQVRHSVGNGWVVHAGAWSGLTVGDPQQSGFRDQDMELGFTLGARMDSSDYGYGISAFIGNRPGFDVDGAVPEADRFLVYLDGFYKITSALDLRGEVMFGNDRDPLLSSGSPVFAGETDVLGYHVQLNYFANPQNQFTVKYESYDPDTGDDFSTNRRINQIGLAYTYHFNKALKLTIAYEHPDEEGAEQRNDTWTIRSQFKI